MKRNESPEEQESIGTYAVSGSGEQVELNVQKLIAVIHPGIQDDSL